jgi:hypothetical protein
MFGRIALSSFLAALALTSGGCLIDPSFEDTAYRCEQSQACPSGFDCVAGVCRAEAAPSSDDPARFEPSSVCGGLGLLRDSFADGEDGWGQAFPAEGAMLASEGQLRASVEPGDADARVGYVSHYAYAMAGDAATVHVASLAGPGWAGVSLGLGDYAVELTLSETSIRCDRRAGGTVERISAPRDGAAVVRVAVHGERAWCTVASAPPEDGVATTWRVIGSHDPLPGELARVSLIVGGSAGQAATTAGFSSINTGRSDDVAGWCSPGAAGDPFDRELVRWRTSRSGECETAARDGDAVIRGSGADFDCGAEYAQPIDLSTGTAGVEVGAMSGPGELLIALAAEGSASQLVSRVAVDRIITDLCDGDGCTRLYEGPRDGAMPWLGYAASGDGLRVVASGDARSWTTLHTVAQRPFDVTGTLVRFGASARGAQEPVEHRIKTFVTQP